MKLKLREETDTGAEAPSINNDLLEVRKVSALPAILAFPCQYN